MIKLRLYELDDNKYDFCAYRGGENKKNSPQIPFFGEVALRDNYLNYRLNDDYIMEKVNAMCEKTINMQTEIKGKAEQVRDGRMYCLLQEAMLYFDIAERDENSLAVCVTDQTYRKLAVRTICNFGGGFTDGEYYYPVNFTEKVMREMLEQIHYVIRSAETKDAVPAALVLAVLSIFPNI